MKRQQYFLRSEAFDLLGRDVIVVSDYRGAAVDMTGRVSRGNQVTVGSNQWVVAVEWDHSELGQLDWFDAGEFEDHLMIIGEET